MNRISAKKSAMVCIALLTAAGTTGCVERAVDPTPAISPTSVSAPYECNIDGSPAGSPVQLELTCDGELKVIGGDFSNKTANSYDVSATGIASAVVVDGEARVWHDRGESDRECLTIQRLDEASPSRDTCTAPADAESEDQS